MKLMPCSNNRCWFAWNLDYQKLVLKSNESADGSRDLLTDADVQALKENYGTLESLSEPSTDPTLHMHGSTVMMRNGESTYT